MLYVYQVNSYKKGQKRGRPHVDIIMTSTEGWTRDDVLKRFNLRTGNRRTVKGVYILEPSGTRPMP